MNIDVIMAEEIGPVDPHVEEIRSSMFPHDIKVRERIGPGARLSHFFHVIKLKFGLEVELDTTVGEAAEMLKKKRLLEVLN